jgi:hypothetical protein
MFSLKYKNIKYSHIYDLQWFINITGYTRNWMHIPIIKILTNCMELSTTREATRC